MTVLGIDPSSRRIALVGNDGPEWFKESWQAPRKEKSRANVLSGFVEPFLDYLDGCLDDSDELWVFVEHPVVGVGGPHPTIVQAQVNGLILALSRYAGADGAYSVNVKTWKRDVVGNGNSSKSDVAEWLESNHPALSELAGEDGDYVDAACIALYGIAVVDRGERLTG